jgi:hypothetical protein
MPIPAPIGVAAAPQIFIESAANLDWRNVQMLIDGRWTEDDWGRGQRICACGLSWMDIVSLAKSTHAT